MTNTQPRSSSRVPRSRLLALNEAPHNEGGRYVLYWMIAARRPRYSFALERAAELAQGLRKPLVILEPLRVGYRWASDRMHAFVIEGMRDHRGYFATTPALYLPYLEPSEGEGEGLLSALAEEACVVVTDDYPCFFLPRMTARAGALLGAQRRRLVAVDGNGLYPMRETERVFTTAYSFRRHLQREIGPHLDRFPREEPLAEIRLIKAEEGIISNEIRRKWNFDDDLTKNEGSLDRFPIDHGVPKVALRGGFRAANEALTSFLRRGIKIYGEERSHPDSDAASGFSPWLHFGHLGAHEVFRALADKEEWSPARIEGVTITGSRSGFWGMSQSAESFIDELITWREVGFNMCAHEPEYFRFESLPEWARTTMDEHREDPRPELYSLEALEKARTKDPIWNAAQRELRVEGRIQNYLRMLWGKKIYEWSPTPEEALSRMIELNNKYAVDGRDPNSYSGIFWVLGRYDRAWGPERPIFGKLRYMSSDSARRKLRLSDYLERWKEPETLKLPGF